MNNFTKGLLLISLLPVAGLSQITYLFHDGANATAAGLAFDDVASSATYLAGGITLTAEAFLDGVSTGTTMNGATDGFGVNANGTGDMTTRLDNINGIESIVFKFDAAGTFDTIDLRYITGDNEAVLSFAGGATYLLTSANVINASADTYGIGASFVANQAITLSIFGSASAGENFSLESFTITPAPTSMPEPSACAALAGVGMFGMAACRRRRVAV